MPNHKEKMDKQKIKLISFISFLLGFSWSLIAYVLSTFFKIASGTENVGIFYTISYIVVLLLLLNMHEGVRKWGKGRFFLFLELTKFFVIALLIFSGFSHWAIVWAMLFSVLVAAEWTALDSILESFSQDKFSGRIRGWHLTVFNAGFLLGPFISTRLLEKYGFQGIFVSLLVLGALTFVVSLAGLRDVTDRFYKKLNALQIIKKIWAKKDIVRIYYVSFVLEFFFALMVIYTPLYLLDLGLSWGQIGVIFTCMLVPFVILQYPVGVLADKNFGERELLIFSVLIMAVSTLLIYFTSSSSVLVWSLILFSTRIGAALIEILRDSYFYKKIDGYDVDIINFFRTAMPAGYILATAISAVTLLFFPIKSSFILVALVVISALYPTLKLKDNKCEKELKKVVRND